jgi:ribose/xylose/arabinose/galactoside ABC-type transport system permease subunit
MSSDTGSTERERLDSAGQPLAEPPAGRGRERGLLVIIATERPLLIVLIIAPSASWRSSRPTFLRPRMPRSCSSDTAQTGILACGMMPLMIAGMFDLSIGGILAFSGIMADWP